MQGFFHIISCLYPEIDITRSAFEHPPDRNSAVNRDFIVYGFLNALHREGRLNPDSPKFGLLKDSILTNVFIDETKREEIMDAFSRAQRCYMALCRLARLWKVKKARRGTVNRDLFMNPLDNFKESLLLDLFDDDSRTLYKFRLSDLMSMARNSLANSPEFFSDPQEIRNPYTNLPFTQAQLYSIYLELKESSFDIPVLFSQYYRAGFDLNEFCERNEAFIREVAIDNFIVCGSDPERYYYTMKMLRTIVAI